jgi:hypothetical protein
MELPFLEPGDVPVADTDVPAVTMGADADVHWCALASLALSDLNLILAALRGHNVRTRACILARVRGRGREASVAGDMAPARSRADQAVADASILVQALAAQTAIAASATRAMRPGFLTEPITLCQVMRRMWFNQGVFMTCVDERESLSPDVIQAAYARYELLRRSSLLSGPELVKELRNGIDSRVGTSGAYELCDDTNTPDGQVWKSIKHCCSGAKVLPPPSTHTPLFFFHTLKQSWNACFRSRSQSSQPCIGYHSDR